VKRIVSRARTRLQTALPSAEIGVLASHDRDDWIRDQRRTVYKIIGEAFQKCPDLLRVSLQPKITYADGDRTVELAVSSAFSLTVRGHSSVVTGVTAAVTGGAGCGPSEMDYAVLQAKRTVFSNLIRVLSLPYLEEAKEMWEAGALDVAREEVEGSMLRGILDVDALIYRNHRFNTRFLDRQADLSRSPAVWNGATIASIPARIAAGMPLHACDDDGISALVAAVATRDKVSCESLLAAGVDPDRVDCAGFSPVAAAILARDIEAFKFLVAAGADPAGAPTLPSLLLVEAAGDPIRAVTAILDAGVDWNYQMPNGLPFAQWMADECEGSSAEWRKQMNALLRARQSQMEIEAALGGEGSGVPARRPASSSGPSL
jgi:hypothetical protein